MTVQAERQRVKQIDVQLRELHKAYAQQRAQQQTLQHEYRRLASALAERERHILKQQAEMQQLQARLHEQNSGVHAMLALLDGHPVSEADAGSSGAQQEARRELRRHMQCAHVQGAGETSHVAGEVAAPGAAQLQHDCRHVGQGAHAHIAEVPKLSTIFEGEDTRRAEARLRQAQAVVMQHERKSSHGSASCEGQQAQIRKVEGPWPSRSPLACLSSNREHDWATSIGIGQHAQTQPGCSGNEDTSRATTSDFARREDSCGHACSETHQGCRRSRAKAEALAREVDSLNKELAQ